MSTPAAIKPPVLPASKHERFILAMLLAQSPCKPSDPALCNKFLYRDLSRQIKGAAYPIADFRKRLSSLRKLGWPIAGEMSKQNDEGVLKRTNKHWLSIEHLNQLFELFPDLSDRCQRLVSEEYRHDKQRVTEDV